MSDNELDVDQNSGNSAGYGILSVICTALIAAILCFIIGFFIRPYLWAPTTTIVGPAGEHFGNLQQNRITERDRQRYLSRY